MIVLILAKWIWILADSFAGSQKLETMHALLQTEAAKSEEESEVVWIIFWFWLMSPIYRDWKLNYINKPFVLMGKGGDSAECKA